MPLILDLEGYEEATLRSIVASLREELAETLERVRNPSGHVLELAGVAAAEALVASTVDTIDRPGPRSRADLAREANLAYAVIVAAVDLLKSHTDLPKVPRRRASAPPPS